MSKKHPTISDALEALFEQTQQRVNDGVRSAATLEMQRAHGRWLAAELGAKLPITSIDEQLLEQLTGPRLPPRRFGAETLRKRMSTLRAAVALAHRRRWVKRQPAFPQVIAPWRPRQRWLTYAQARQLFEALPRHRAEWTWVCLWTGMHASDVNALRWLDVDLNERSLILRNTKNRKVTGVRVRCPRALWSLLREMHTRDRPKPGDRVVRPWHSRGHTLLRACIKAGIPQVSAIDLRHTCATWMVRRLGIVPSVLAWLGHSSPAMAARTYAHAVPPQLGDCADELDSVVDAPPKGGAKKAA